MLVHVYKSKGAAYKALKELVRYEREVTDLDRENLRVTLRGVSQQFIWRKGVEYPYAYWSNDGEQTEQAKEERVA